MSDQTTDSTTDHDAPWPTELRLSADKDMLALSYENGPSETFSAEFLRVHSPSAEVQGHSPEQRKTVPGKKDVAISSLEPVGHYAIRIIFADGHHTGIFSWQYFAELARDREALWQRYLSELAEKGLSRDK